MERIRQIWDRHRFALVASIFGLVVVGGLAAKHLPVPHQETAAAVQSAPAEDLIVDVEGAVAVPGVRHLVGGSLVEDAIVAAGGVTDQADADRLAKDINRADNLKNHQKIYIPLQGEAPSGSSASDSSQAGGKINLNSASKEELDKLPGVGPSTAQKILDYREQKGRFESPEELKEVPGIGDSKYETMKDQIAV